jgi:hypothetical protein
MGGFSSITGNPYGTVLNADNVSFDGTTRGGIITANGELLIGSAVAPHIRKGSLTSSGGSVTITVGQGTINLEAGAAVPTTFTGNSGVATPAANNLNVVTANSTVQFVGSGSTLTQDFGLSNLFMGGPNSITVGTGNVCIGLNSGDSITSGINSTALGTESLQAATIANNNVAIGVRTLRACTGNDNTFVGTGAGEALTTSINNTGVGLTALATETTGLYSTAIGYRSLFNQNGGARNCAIGTDSGLSITTGVNNTCLGSFTYGNNASPTTGSYNIMVGQGAGYFLTGSNSSNILIGELVGNSGDNNVIRIGTQGTGNGQQTQCYLAGVLNTVSGRVVKVTTPGGYPYTTLTTDYVILVDTSAARTITPLANPVTGTTYRIKDSVGSASTNNITVTPSGKNIDGAASFVMNVNYQSIDICYNGTEWSIL